MANGVLEEGEYTGLDVSDLHAEITRLLEETDKTIFSGTWWAYDHVRSNPHYREKYGSVWDAAGPLEGRGSDKFDCESFTISDADKECVWKLIVLLKNNAPRFLELLKNPLQMSDEDVARYKALGEYTLPCDIEYEGE